MNEEEFGSDVFVRFSKRPCDGRITRRRRGSRKASAEMSLTPSGSTPEEETFMLPRSHSRHP